MRPIILVIAVGLMTTPVQAHGPMPDGVETVARALAPGGERLDVYLSAPHHLFVTDGVFGIDEATSDELLRALWAEEAVAGRDTKLRAIVPWVVDPQDADGGWVPLHSLGLPLSPPAPKPHEPPLADARNPQKMSLVATDAPGFSAGALSGKVVYVSAGHGFYRNDDVLNRWATQRGNTNGIVEDLVSAEAVNQYMVRYLVNAGATVFTARERDMNPQMVIVDRDTGDPGTHVSGGTYAETGSGWADSAQSGFRAGIAPYTGDTNPFAQGANRVVETVSGAPTASAQWTPIVPSDGNYHVYVSYSQDGSRVRDAHYVVRHAGGETELRVNQERHGKTWVDLGRYYFYAGQDHGRGAVVLHNDTSLEPGDFVSADAVRLGGGMGDFQRTTVSGRPRFEECSRYSAQFNGAPTTVYNRSGTDRSDDVGTRPRYAAWQNESGEDSVYVAWHTNAPDPGRGTSTYVYGTNSPDGSYQFAGTAGSDILAQEVHGAIVGDLRQGWDPEWTDRRIRSAYFGEVNPNNNPEMPAVLVEVAFHDTAADAQQLKEPEFRDIVARAFYKGIVRYFARRDGVTAQLLPNPVTEVSIAGTGETTARITWTAPGTGDGSGAATAYTVYRSVDGRGWDNGTLAMMAMLDVEDLLPGEPAFFRVTATNAGGESFSSPVVAVSTSCNADATPALLVYGFYRLDGSSLPVETFVGFSLGDVVRLRQDAVNRFDYIIEHARAFAAAGVPFDGAEATAVAAGRIALDDYTVLDWILGEESTVDETFSSVEQGLVSSWVQRGAGRLLVAGGAELGWDLDERGSAADKAFFNTVFGVDFASDRSASRALMPVGVLSGQPSLTLDDGTLGSFDVFYPDVLSPRSGAASVLDYANGDGAAATMYAGTGYSAVAMGVPLEALYPNSARDAFMGGILDAAEVAPIPAGGCGVTQPDGDTGDTTGGDTSTPTDTGTLPDSGMSTDTGIATDTGAPADGITVSTPGRTTAFNQREVDEGCAIPGQSVPLLWWVAFVWLGLRRRRRD